MNNKNAAALIQYHHVILTQHAHWPSTPLKFIGIKASSHANLYKPSPQFSRCLGLSNPPADKIAVCMTLDKS